MSDGLDDVETSPGATRQAWLPDAGVLLLFILLSVIMTWPLARNLERAVSDSGDPLLNTWIMEWTRHSLTNDPTGFWHAPVFHPLRYTIAFSENLLGITLPVSPLFAAGLKPLVVYNLTLLLGFAFSGFGAYVLGRLVTGSRLAGLVAGIFFAFVPYRFEQIAHIQHVWSGWLPLSLAALFYYGRRPGWKRATLLGVALLFNGLSNGHWLLFGAVGIGLGAMLLGLLYSRLGDRRFWLPLVVVLGVTHGGMYLFLQPYEKAAELYEMERGGSEAANYSAVPTDWLSGGRYNRFYGGTSAWDRAERSLFPGALVVLIASCTVFLFRREDLEVELPSPKNIHFSGGVSSASRRLLTVLDVIVIIAFIAMAVGFADRGSGRDAWRSASLPAVALLVFGFVRLWIAYPTAWSGANRSLSESVRRSRWNPETWVCALWVVIGFLGSLGMNSFFHQFLFSNLSPFRSLRVPARWAMITYVGLAALAALGTVALLARVKLRRRAFVFVALSLLMLLELRAAPLRWYLFDSRTAPVYTWLETAEFGGAVLELPIGERWSEYIYMYNFTSHHRPLINGVSGYPTKQHARIKAAVEATPVAESFLESLADIGCGLIVVHNEKYGTPDSVRAWLRDEVAAGRLAFVRRFDHGAGGDYVFAVTAVTAPGILRGDEAPDAAGRMPDENAMIFLDENGRTYNATTFGWVDRPAFNDEVKGELAVSGWAMSPYGVREVRLSFENRGVRFQAELLPYPRISEIFPWYPETKTPGFGASFPERPDGVGLVTDLLIEVVDGRGEIVPLDHLFLEWHPRKPVSLKGLAGGPLGAVITRLGIDESERASIVGGDPAPLVAAILAASEDETNGEFIDSAYQLLLDREPEAEAKGYYLTRLGRGGTRRDVIEGILTSKEFRNRMTK